MLPYPVEGLANEIDDSRKTLEKAVGRPGLRHIG